MRLDPLDTKKKATTSESQQVDTDHLKLSRKIEEDLDHYTTYRDMPYSDNGDVQGLLTRCKNANILEKSSRRDKETLAKKLYILEVKKDKEKAIQYGPTRTIPKQTNSTALAVYDLLTSPERCALVMGHLITRI